MIHDKDYIIRIVKQFSEMLSKMIFGKTENFSQEEQMVFETQMKDIFKMDFGELHSLSVEEIENLILKKDEPHQIHYFELLGHLFYFSYLENPAIETANKSKKFYELWVQKSGIFSLPVMNRISELKTFVDSL